MSKRKRGASAPKPAKASKRSSPADLSPQIQGLDQRAYHPSRLEALFQVYAEDGGFIREEGICQLIEDLGIDETGVESLHLMYMINAEEMQISKEQFEGGLAGIKCDSVAKMRPHLRHFPMVFRADAAQFKDFYCFVFRHLREGNKKFVDVAMALEMWPLVLSGDDLPLLPRFLEFVAEFMANGEVKSITQDQWSTLLDFLGQVDSDLEGYDPAAAWPCLLDDFVEWLQAKQKQ